MAVHVLDYSVNVSLTLDELEDLERDFTKLTGTAAINPDLAPLQHQAAPYAHHTIQRATKRKRSDGKSSTNSVPTTAHSSAAPAPKKRPRAKISSEGLQLLEGIFAETPFIVGKERHDLAARLDNQVGQWFEYRRRCLRQAHKRNNTQSVWRPDYVGAPVAAFDANSPTICAGSQGLMVTASSPQLFFAPTQFQANYSASLVSNSSPPLIWQQGYYDASPYSASTSNTPSFRQDFRCPGDFSSSNSVGSSFASYETSSLWPEEVEDFLREHCMN